MQGNDELHWTGVPKRKVQSSRFILRSDRRFRVQYPVTYTDGAVEDKESSWIFRPTAGE